MKQLFKPIITITFFSALGLVVGILLQIILAFYFGTTKEMDAYLAATTVPFLIVSIIQGAVNHTFVPVFIDYRKKIQNRESEAWNFAWNFTFRTSLILLIIAVLGIIGAQWLSRLTTPGFNTELLLLEAGLMKVQFITTFFVGMSCVLMNLYYVQHRFTLPAAIPFINTIAMIVVVFIFASKFGVKSVVFGALVGGIVQFSILAPVLLKKWNFFSIRNSNSGQFRIFKLMLPLLLGAILYRAHIVVDRLIASSMPEGSISYLGYASRLIFVFCNLIVGGVAIVVFPLMSEYASENNIVKFKQIFSQSVRMVLFILIPFVVGLIVLRNPLVEFLLQRGAFNVESSQVVSNLLICYLGVLFGTALGYLISRAFYSLQDTWIPVKIGIVAIVAGTILKFLLARYFSYQGLALASSVTFLFSSIFLLGFLKRKIGHLDGRRILHSFIKIALLSLLMGGILLIGRNYFSGTARLWGVFSLGIFSYLILAFVFKLEESRLIFSYIKRN